MKISIVMTTYNGEKYLKDQLCSFLNQTRIPDEVVICDDNSRDKTCEILYWFKKVANFDVRIFVNDNNIGYIKNFEQALRLSKGDLIFLSDQDDVWFPTKVKIVSDLFVMNPNTLFIVNDQVITDENLLSTGRTKMQNFRELGISLEKFVTGCCTAFRSNCKDIILPFPNGIIAHDDWINNLAVALKARMIYDKPLQFYRRHGNNVSNSLVSSKEKPIKKIVLNSKDSVLKNFQLQVLFQTNIYNRLVSRGKEYNDDLDSQLTTLKKNILSLKRRIQILSVSRFNRIRIVLYAYKHGFYDDYSGYKSACLDLIR